MIFIILYAFFDALFQWSIFNKIKIKEYEIFHALNMFIKGIFILAICYLNIPPFFKSWLIFCLESALIYWIVFDLTYNIISGLKWNYKGGGLLDFKYNEIVKGVGLILVIYEKVS